ncbi:hypothetical protein N177_1551 [Lutibaculum baratangense AMV1]|uniref:Uncharacterized protein n=1 Tax=Lutibaculum baratangense AMV1 TaxID=631454 RepID=V4TI88_9HYPH|nr:hypothetical protein N177_1551 [Lutibaculum baratangense AMV1]
MTAFGEDAIGGAAEFDVASRRPFLGGLALRALVGAGRRPGREVGAVVPGAVAGVARTGGGFGITHTHTAGCGG